jgi:hypothetical protein
VLEVAREAFVQGMQVAAGISAVMAIAVAVLAVVVLRNMSSGEPGASSDADEGRRSDPGNARPEVAGAGPAAAGA